MHFLTGNSIIRRGRKHIWVALLCYEGKRKGKSKVVLATLKMAAGSEANTMLPSFSLGCSFSFE